MKTIIRIVLPVYCALAMATPAGAGIIAFDNFSYADGALVPNGGWETHSGTAGDLTVSGGKAVVQHGQPSEDAHISFTPVLGDIFYALDMTVTAASAIFGSDNEYFAHFKDTGSNFAARLDVVPGTAGGDYSLGLATDSSSADSTWAVDLFFGTTYRAIVKYDQVINQAMLWVDATSISDIFIASDDLASPADKISQFALRQSDSNLNETIHVDNLVIGTSFNDVVRPFTASVPEPDTLLLTLLGLIFVIYSARIAGRTQGSRSYFVA